MDCFGDIVKYNNNFDTTLETTISRYYRRCAKSPAKSWNLLVTENINLAALYKTSTDCLVQTESWTFPQLNRLQFPAVTAKDPTNSRDCLWAVQEPNTLSQWSFGKKKGRLCKHVFAAKISGIVVFDDKPMEPIVVFEDGFCQSMSNAIDSKSEAKKLQIITKGETIQSIDGLVDKNSNNILIYLITKSVNSKPNLIKSVYKLTLDSKAKQITKIECQSVSNSLYCWTLCHKSGAILAVNQSDNKIVIFSFNGETKTRLMELTSSCIKSVVSVCATATGSVCLIGKTANSTPLLELWEVRYGSRMAQMELPYESMANDSKVIDNTLLITCGKGIVLVPIKTETIALSQMIDKIRTNKPIGESDSEQELNQIVNDLSSDSTESLNDINERFDNILRQKNYLISEEMILKLVIVCSSKLSETDSSQRLRPLFETLLSLPFNELFMISRLKSSQLNFTQISSILKLMTEIISLKNINSIVDWISILIDAHIDSFFIRPNVETVSLIEAIDHKIDELGYFCEQLGQIKTLFEIIVSKSRSKPVINLPAPKRGQYCIELLNF